MQATHKATRIMRKLVNLPSARLNKDSLRHSLRNDARSSGGLSAWNRGPGTSGNLKDNLRAVGEPDRASTPGRGSER